MTCNCRCIAQATRDYLEAGSHLEETAEFACLMCHDENQIFDVHGVDGDYACYSYECANCHDFVRYLENDNITHYKDEFYYKELCIINDVDAEYTHISKVNEAGVETTVAIIPFVKFIDKESFWNKIKIYLVFT